MSELPPRITGTEMEWSILTRREGEEDYSQMDGSQPGNVILKHLPADLKRLKAEIGNKGCNLFLSNGARLYLDTGSHIEYATPEDDSLWGTVSNEIASETIMRNMLDAYTADTTVAYKLNKRVAGQQLGITWGYHENYYMPQARALPIGDGRAVIAGHLASRGVLTGAGYQTADGNFYVCQKSSQVLTDVDSGTTNRNKPLFNTRDEPHNGKAAVGKRLHVIVGDPNMSPWASFMNLATTSLVLRLVENNMLPSKQLSTGIGIDKVAQIFGRDPTLTASVEGSDGRSLTALNMQEILFASAARLSSRMSLPLEEKDALGKWEQAIADLRDDPLKTVDRIDWTAKLAGLRRQQAKHGLSDTDGRLQGMDWRWDEISNNGTALHLRNKQQPNGTRWANDDLDTQLCIDRQTRPPANTRASDRGRFILAAANRLNAAAAWDSLSYDEKTVTLSDPRITDREKVTDLITQMSSPGDADIVR